MLNRFRTLKLLGPLGRSQKPWAGLRFQPICGFALRARPSLNVDNKFKSLVTQLHHVCDTTSTSWLALNYLIFVERFKKIPYGSSFSALTLTYLHSCDCRFLGCPRENTLEVTWCLKWWLKNLKLHYWTPVNWAVKKMNLKGAVYNGFTHYLCWF